MSEMSKGNKYKCELCELVVVIEKPGKSGDLICCDSPMKLVKS